MSYTIEYAKLFLKSALGYTPCWECGSNNTYETARKRARQWCVWQNLLGVSSEQIMEAALQMCDGEGDHWQKSGKWVDDAGLVRWVKLGVAKAVTIEDVLSANPFLGAIYCRALVWDANRYRSECEAQLRSTEDLDHWIRAVNELKHPGITVYPVIDLSLAKRPIRPSGKVPEHVIIKYKKAYLTQSEDDGDYTSWSTDIRKSLVMSREDAMRLQERKRYTWVGQSKLLDARNKLRKTAVLRKDDGSYLSKHTKRRIICVQRKDGAHQYSSIAAAADAAQRLNQRLKGQCRFFVEEMKDGE